MKKTIKVAIKLPGMNPFFTEVANELDMLQALVFGDIETVTLGSIVAIVNEEGLLKKMPFTCHFDRYALYGPIVFCGVDGEEFADFPFTEEQFKKLYPLVFEEDT